jgi:transglutaminase-like putative cysteine protease
MGSEARTRLALIALLVVTLFSFGQVFDRGNWPGPALLGMALSGVIVVGARRLGVATGWTIVASLVGLVWYTAFIFRMHDLYYGLPTPTSLDGVWSSVVAAYKKSNVDYAPVPLRTGYVILTVVGMWVSTTIAEIAAFRWRRPLVATLPLIALFSLLTVVGTRTGTTIPVLFFLAALLSFLALESSHRLRSWGSWITSLADRNAETPGEVSSRLARRMGASCLAAALFSPVFLPAIGDGILSWRSDAGVGPGSGSGPGTGEVDLLASLQPQIIEQSQAEMFTVDAERADYWRLTSLINFDGTLWTPLDQQPREPLIPGGRLVSAHPPRLYETMQQQFSVRGLKGELMPAATQADRVSVTNNVNGQDDTDLSFELETGTVRMRGGLVEGVGYSVESDVVRASFKEMNRAEVAGAPPIYYDEGLIAISPQVEALIDEWTSKFDTPFKKLVALQDNLRQFTYSIDVPPSASTDQLSDFLLRTKRGYCQQFAAAFALIARHLGFPTRVSIGFLPGETDLAEPTHFLVKGTDAHAWPEVLFEDYGWVRFEPTPGNGAAPPGYTSRAIPFSVNNPFSDTGGGSANGPNPGTLPGNQNVPTGGRDRGGAVDPSGRSGANERPVWEETFSTVLSIVLLALLVFIALVPLMKMARTSFRYRRAASPSALAEAAFAHFEAEAAELASARSPSESATGFARRLGEGYKIPRGNAVELAAIYEKAAYASSGIENTTAQRARRLAVALRGELWAGATTGSRIKRLFSPAGLLSR